MGDAAGIGPEIIVKALTRERHIFIVPANRDRESRDP